MSAIAYKKVVEQEAEIWSRGLSCLQLRGLEVSLLNQRVGTRASLRLHFYSAWFCWISFVLFCCDAGERLLNAMPRRLYYPSWMSIMHVKPVWVLEFGWIPNDVYVDAWQRYATHQRRCVLNIYAAIDVHWATYGNQNLGTLCKTIRRYTTGALGIVPKIDWSVLGEKREHDEISVGESFFCYSMLLYIFTLSVIMYILICKILNHYETAS